jgi:hypothetical protein
MLSYSLAQLLYSEDERYVITVHPLVHTWLRERLDVADRRRLTHESVLLFYRAFGFAPYNYTVRNYRNSPGRNFSIGQNHLSEILANCERYPTPGISRDVLLQPPVQDDTSSYYGLAKHWLDGYYLWARWYVEERVKYVLYQLNPDPSRLDSWEMVYQIDQRSDFMKHTGPSFKAWILKEIWAQYPLKHPLSLRSAGVYIDTLLVAQSPTLQIAMAWLTWLRSAREQVLGKTHPATMGAYIGLGRVLSLGGHCEESARYLEEAYSVRKQVLGPSDLLTNRAWGFLRGTVDSCRDPQSEDVPLFLRTFEEAATPKEKILRTTPLVTLHQAAKQYLLADKQLLSLEVLAFIFAPRANHAWEMAELAYISRGLDLITKMDNDIILKYGKIIVNLLGVAFRDDGGLEFVEIAIVAGYFCLYLQDGSGAAEWMHKASDMLGHHWLDMEPYQLVTQTTYRKLTRTGLTDVLRRFFRIWGLPPTDDALQGYKYLPTQDSAVRKRWFELVNDIVGLCLADMIHLDGRARLARQTEGAQQLPAPVEAAGIYKPQFFETWYHMGLLARCFAMGKLWLDLPKYRWDTIELVRDRLETVEKVFDEDESESCFSDLRYTYQCHSH